MLRALALVLLAAPAFGAELKILDDAQRREAVKTATKDELAQAMQQTPPRTLILIGKQAVAALGTYSYRMGKTERVKGELLDEQTIDVFVKEDPFAVRLEYVKGPAAGRKVLYNSKERADEFRVHESGFFGVFGKLWVSVDSSMAKTDSNHTVKEAGLARLLNRLESDLDKGDKQGGFKVTHEGWNASGEWCAIYEAPNEGKGFSAYKTRICTDLSAGLPMKVESYDARSHLLERYLFSDVKTVSKPAAFFETGSL
ncbi:MAG: DUF1571 domain-containing protein [Myxococcaceae bacterium]